MIILKTFSDNTTGKQRELLNNILTDYMRKEKRSRKKKEALKKIKDITNDPNKLRVAGIGTLGAGTIVAGSVVVRKKLKKKVDKERSEKRIKDQILGED